MKIQSKASTLKAWLKPMLSLMAAAIAMVMPVSHAAELSWAYVGGEVIDVEGKSFTIDAGDKNFKVLLKDWNWFQKEATELRGQKVRVVGQVEVAESQASITPMGITLTEWNVHHHVPGFDHASMIQASRPLAVTELLICGKVTAVEGRMLTIDTGKRRLIVNTRGIVGEITDSEGYQQIKVGHRVLVAAGMDRSYITEGRVEASRVISLIPNLAH